jgi:hypothetical protein
VSIDEQLDEQEMDVEEAERLLKELKEAVAELDEVERETEQLLESI